MAQTLTINGSHIKVYANAALIGITTSVTFSIDYGRRVITGIDVQSPTEITSGQVKIKGSISLVRLKQDGGPEGYNLVPTIADISLEKYLSISLVDRYTDSVIFRTDNALISNQSWTIKNRQIITGTVTFDSIDYCNELGSGTLISDTINNLISTD